MTENSGAFRCISHEEAERLDAAGEQVEWAEGCGFIVYDQIALDKFKQESASMPGNQFDSFVRRPYHSSGEANNCEQEEGA